MKICIQKKEDVKKFANIFKNIGNLQEFFKLNFTKTGVTGQAMDSAHVCLFELNLVADWFGEFEIEEDGISVGVASSLFCKMIDCITEDQTITITMGEDDDRISVDLVGGKGLNKYFELPLIDIDVESMEIPDTEYTVDMILKSDLFSELVDEFALFNEVLNLKCTEEFVQMTANGEAGKMSVNMKNDDIIELAIEEESDTQLSFSLLYLHKMCMFRKLSPTLSLHLSVDIPMKLEYKLGDNSEEDPNYMRFFLAPKIDDM
jgi:proliferating cell nuclear antigen